MPNDRFKPLHWLQMVSQQSSVQYILFFSVPLLWRAEQWAWLALVVSVGLSTLWDPLYDRLWAKPLYQAVVLTLSLALVTALSLVTWNSWLLQYNIALALLCCVVSQGAVLLSRREPKSPSKSQWLHLRSLKNWWPGLTLFIFFFLSGASLPPLGVWLVDGQVSVLTESKSLECSTRIAAPAGFKSEVIHKWTIVGENNLLDEVRLSEITGNGIDEKPFTTRSRKKAFPLPFEEMVGKRVRCSVVLPGSIALGSVEMSSQKH